MFQMFQIGQTLIDMQTPPRLGQALFLEPTEKREIGKKIVVHTAKGDDEVYELPGHGVAVLGFPSAVWTVSEDTVDWFAQFCDSRPVAPVYITTWTPAGFKTFSATLHRPRSNRIRFTHLVEV